MLALLWAAFAIAAIIYCIVQACKCRFKKAGAVFVGAFVLWVAAAFIAAPSKVNFPPPLCGGCDDLTDRR